MKIKFQSALFVFAFFALGTLTTSCDKEATDTTPENLKQPTEEDAVDAMTGALQASTEGMAQEIDATADLAESYTEKSGGSPCGETFDSTFVRSVNETNITAEYAFTWEWSLDCNAADIPLGLNLATTSSGTYETARMLSQDASSSTWTVDSLFTGANYVFNGTFERTGAQESKVRNQNVFTSVITIEVDDLNIDKGTKQIKSGIAEATIVITGSGGNTQTFSGDLVFNGDGSVTLIINGNSYTIDLF
jgi:hypothetical protein